jgi:ERCC4-related helicase
MNHHVVGSLHKGGIKPLFEYISTSALGLGDLSDLEINDSKYKSLITQLKEYWEINPNKKVILFSFFKATLRYLKERLKKERKNATEKYSHSENPQICTKLTVHIQITEKYTEKSQKYNILFTFN